MDKDNEYDEYEDMLGYKREYLVKAIIGVVVDQNGYYIYSLNDKLPIKNKADLQYFRKLTVGHPVIMGRKTWETLKSPLPNRTNYIISRKNSREFLNEDQMVDPSIVHIYNIDNKKKLLRDIAELHDSDIWIIGGEEIYKEFIDEIDEFHLCRQKEVIQTTKEDNLKILDTGNTILRFNQYSVKDIPNSNGELEDIIYISDESAYIYFKRYHEELDRDWISPGIME